MILPALVITDVDGVLTDGGIFYDELGNKIKKFNTSDGSGVLFLRALDIPVAIISGDPSEAVRNRGKKLNLDHVYVGVHNKVEKATEICQQLGIDLQQVAFIGDDLVDLKLLQQVGFSAAPANAPDYVKERVDYVTTKKGGDGAFREFVEYILIQNKLLDQALAPFL